MNFAKEIIREWEEGRHNELMAMLTKLDTAFGLLSQRIDWLEHAVFPKKKEEAEQDYLKARQDYWDRMNGTKVTK